VRLIVTTDTLKQATELKRQAIKIQIEAMPKSSTNTLDWPVWLTHRDPSIALRYIEATDEATDEAAMGCPLIEVPSNK